jgi:glycosyltransferase involved in cell wall biosynthesis
VDTERFRPPSDDERTRLRAALGLPDGGFVVGWCGRMEVGKNVELAIDAVGLARSAIRRRCGGIKGNTIFCGTGVPPVVCDDGVMQVSDRRDAGPTTRGIRNIDLLLVGDGTQRAPLQDRARRLGLADRVRFLGTREDAAACLQACDAFVFPSVSESFGIAVIEAMACGLPCVALANRMDRVCCGAAEAIVDGVTGRLLDDDGPEAMADCLASWAREPATAVSMGQAGRRRVVEHFAAGRDGAQLEKILELACS